jgi:hypothetical protein
MGKIRNPEPPPKETRFSPTWKTGKATERHSFPPAVTPCVLAIARIIDRNPEIADQVLKFAQSLEQSTK